MEAVKRKVGRPKKEKPPHLKPYQTAFNPVRLGLNQACFEFSISADFLTKRFRAFSILPGVDGKFSIADVCTAKYGSKEMEAMRNLRAQADARELENAKTRSDLISRPAVLEFCEKLALTIRQVILSCNMTDEEKEQALVELNKLLDQNYVVTQVCSGS